LRKITNSPPTPRHLVTRRRRSAANLLLVAPAFGAMAGISVGVMWVIQQFQSMRCPAGTFLCSSGRAAEIAQICPIFIASVGFSLLGVNWLAYRIPPVRRFFDRNAREHGEPAYQRSQRGIAKLSAVLLMIMLPLTVAASFSQYCLQAQGILYQPWPWTGLRHYAWGDVASIETSCTRSGRGGWNGSFFLTMRDGASFDIMAWPRSVENVYPQIVRALSGVEFVFNSNDVKPGCAVPYVNLLVQRP